MNVNKILTNYIMQYPKPQEGITIYTKTGCNYCIKVKQLLEEKNQNFTIIDCDKFILENKDNFLLFIRDIIGKEYRLFPIVFSDNIFIGGYNETLNYFTSLQHQLLDFDLNF
jgi:glutaredoxin